VDAAAHHPQQGDFRITLLGTGSPRPSLTRHHPAAFVQWGEGGHMLVDAGDGVVSQLLAAGIALESITQIALTHMHWDGSATGSAARPSGRSGPGSGATSEPPTSR
jgi:ribonuclease Z